MTPGALVVVAGDLAAPGKGQFPCRHRSSPLACRIKVTLLTRQLNLTSHSVQVS